MNNQSLNHFAYAPMDLSMSRSRMSRNFDHKTSLNAGVLVPIFWDDILPGDTVKLSLGSLARMTTPLFPVMDNAFMDVHCYFVPNRLIWEHWEEFMGENKTDHWTPSTTHRVPIVNPPANSGDNVSGSAVRGWAKGSLADYLGVPIKKPVKISALPVRAYCKIWNDWYRATAIQDPVSIPMTDNDTSGSNYGTNKSSYSAYLNGSYVNYTKGASAPLPVSKFADYFTTCLPSPQRGPAVSFGLSGLAPVGNTIDLGSSLGTNTGFSPKFYTVDGVTEVANGTYPLYAYKTSSANGLDRGASTSVTSPVQVKFNLSADLSQASAVTVNALREAFALQRYFEKIARGGDRYISLIKTFFGVDSPDARLQRSEFLGGKRVPINITQVAQTAAGSDSVVGDLAAYSQTLERDDLFTHSFVEHGILMVCVCIRTARTYQQGLAKKFLRRDLADFYNPTFANLGEMPVKNVEIFAQGTTADDEVFGFQEAWGDYRYSPNQVSGMLRSDYAQSLDQWHYADEYASLPTLSPTWLREPQTNVARTLSVDNIDDQGVFFPEVDQFIADFAFDMTWVRVMPLYSIPGLIDHH